MLITSRMLLGVALEQLDLLPLQLAQLGPARLCTLGVRAR